MPHAAISYLSQPSDLKFQVVSFLCLLDKEIILQKTITSAMRSKLPIGNQIIEHRSYEGGLRRPCPPYFICNYPSKIKKVQRHSKTVWSRNTKKFSSEHQTLGTPATTH
eukprot:5239877-Amphidinium_carterae.1